MRTSATETENFGGAPAAANSSLLEINKKQKSSAVKGIVAFRSGTLLCCDSANPGVTGKIILEAL